MFCATLPAVLYIDKLGRKPVLALGAIAMVNILSELDIET